MNDRHAKIADASGIGLSLLCMAHCFLLPVIAVLAPALLPSLSGWLFTGESAHMLFFLIAAPISIAAFFWGARLSGAGWRTLTTAGIGLVLMFVGATHIFGDLAETVLTGLGVTLLAGAHFVNWRTRARQGHDHEDECVLCDSEAPAAAPPPEPGHRHDASCSHAHGTGTPSLASPPANDRRPASSAA